MSNTFNLVKCVKRSTKYTKDIIKLPLWKQYLNMLSKTFFVKKSVGKSSRRNSLFCIVYYIAVITQFNIIIGLKQFNLAMWIHTFEDSIR